MQPFVINIGRQLGSGGRAIGRLLAKDLGINYYDREILLLAAKESGFTPEIFERSDEKNHFLRTLGNIIPFVGGSESFYNNELSNENLFRIQSEAIQKAADEHSCIFIGRCADYVLRNHPRCVNVFVSASREDRIARLCRLHGISENEAEEMMNRADKKRSEYYNYYSYKTWGMASTYHLCIDSSVLGIEKTVDFIEEFVRLKLK